MLRIDPERGEHREALRDALLRGVDLFDLGDFANAGFAAKAELLRGLIAEHANRRTRIIVRANLGAASRLAYTLEGIQDPEIEWIALVADPEFALPTLEWDHAELYTLLAHELDTLENSAAQGLISAYGVASAGLTYPKENPEALALEPMILGREAFAWDPNAAAGLRAANRRHFGWIEFPLNLCESGAATEPNQAIGAGHGTLLEAAATWKLVTVARRPFDAFTEMGLRRLVAYPDHHKLDLDEAVKRTLETAIAAERAVEPTRFENAVPPIALWAHRLHDQLRHVSDPEQWKEVLRRRIDPDLLRLEASPEPTPALDHYLDAMEALLLSVRLWLEKAAAERNERLRCRIVEAVPALGRRRLPTDRDLALLALRIYRSVPGLGAILVGMRSPRYVAALADAEAGFTDDDRLPPEELDGAWAAVHAVFHESLPEKGNP